MLLAVAIGMLAVGARRAYQHPEKYHGRVSGPILGSLSLLLMGLFLVSIFYLARKVPASAGAPRPGQAAPDFTLPDASGNMVTLSSLVSSPFASNDWPAQGSAQASGANGKTAGAVLIFYRGYW